MLSQIITMPTQRGLVQAAVSTVYTQLWVCHPQQEASDKFHLTHAR